MPAWMQVLWKPESATATAGSDWKAVVLSNDPTRSGWVPAGYLQLSGDDDDEEVVEIGGERERNGNEDEQEVGLGF
eukprot:COSAG05_NODE_1658_length_4325_cov_6.217700_1_plen_76_part_00